MPKRSKHDAATIQLVERRQGKGITAKDLHEHLGGAISLSGCAQLLKRLLAEGYLSRQFKYPDGDQEGAGAYYYDLAVGPASQPQDGTAALGRPVVEALIERISPGKLQPGDEPMPAPEKARAWGVSYTQIHRCRQVFCVRPRFEVSRPTSAAPV